jgi:uncharacterized protein (TIGR02284 family)
MSSDTAQLNELIEITRDGEQFYCHAAQEVGDQRLRSLFEELARAKQQLVETLALALAARHEEPPRGGTLLGSLQRIYVDARARLSRDEDAVYVAQLADAEARILRAFEEARGEAPTELQTLLDRELPQIRACHARMQELKGSA